MKRRTDRDPSTPGKSDARSRAGRSSGSGPAHRWSFLSNHAHVLICLAMESDARLRDVADRIGITERTVQKILIDLESEGLVERRRQGRRNAYELHLDKPLRHPIEAHRRVGELVALILGSDGPERRRTRG